MYARCVQTWYVLKLSQASSTLVVRSRPPYDLLALVLTLTPALGHSWRAGVQVHGIAEIDFGCDNVRDRSGLSHNDHLRSQLRQFIAPSPSIKAIRGI